jgi:hypothetical protein
LGFLPFAFLLFPSALRWFTLAATWTGEHEGEARHQNESGASEALMEYSRLIQDAWAMTWRHRFLWLLGVFAGGVAGVGGGSGAQWRTDQRELEQISPEAGAAAAVAQQWALENLGLLIGIGLAILLLGLVFVALSLIAQGGMARATADLATGQPITPGQAWAAGLHLVWRYLGLWVLLALAAIIVAVVVGAGIALLFGLADAMGTEAPRTEAPRWLVFFIALGIPTLLVALVVGIGVSMRAIAVEDVGPWAALGVGWTLLRQHLGTSLLVWLLGLVLGIAAGIGIGVGALVALAVLTPIGVAFWLAAGGFTAATIAYIAVALVAFLGVVLTLGGIANTFLWAYWTLAYLRLGGEPEPAF